MWLCVGVGYWVGGCGWVGLHMCTGTSRYLQRPEEGIWCPGAGFPTFVSPQTLVLGTKLESSGRDLKHWAISSIPASPNPVVCVFFTIGFQASWLWHSHGSRYFQFQEALPNILWKFLTYEQNIQIPIIGKQQAYSDALTWFSTLIAIWLKCVP